MSFDVVIDSESTKWTTDALFALVVAGALAAALGLVRPVRREIVPRSAHVVQAQILLSIVGAVIVVVVTESLARAFAVVGAAGLIRYRSRIEAPKDASRTTKIIRDLDAQHGTSVEWEIKKYETVLS